MTMIDTRIKDIPLTQLRPWAQNARMHSKKQIRQLAASIKAFGFTMPVLVDEAKNILAGHARVEAAKLLGMDSVPCLCAAHMNAAQKRAYVLADNQLALNASWDEDLLAKELAALQNQELGFELEITGFSVAEIDALIDGAAPAQAADPREDALPAKAPKRCQPGDIWRLGRHRLICGNSLEPATITALMDGKHARMVFTDPPYNVPIAGHASGLGAIRHKDFAMAAGEMSAAQFTCFLRTACENLTAHTADGSIHFICMDWRHMGELLAATHGVYAECKNLIVWVKDNGGMGTFYRSRHELIFVFKHGGAPHINNFELGQHGRYRTNVWNYRGMNSPQAGRAEALALHPTLKPTALIADAIKDVSARGDIVLDIFGGAGSTLIAAEKTGRTAYLCEIDARYCDIILARYEAWAKDDAERMACGVAPKGGA